MAQIQVYKEAELKPTQLQINVEDYSTNEQSYKLQDYVTQATIVLDNSDPSQRVELTADSFKLDMTGFMPRLTVYLTDWTRAFSDTLYRGDRRVIFFLDSFALDTVAPFHMDFYVMSLDQPQIDGDRVTVLNCVMFMPQIFNFGFNYYADEGTQRPGERKGITSWQAMKRITDETGLGFASNVSKTNDRQVWLQPGIHKLEMLQHLIMHSWKGPESFMWGFIDRFYNFNYVDVERCYSAEFQQDSMLRMNLGYRADLPNDTNTREAYPSVPMVITNHNLWSQTNHFATTKVPDGRLTEQEALLSSHYGRNRFVSWYDTTGSWNDSIRSELRNSPNKDSNWAGTFNTELLDTVNYKSREQISDRRLDFFRGNSRISYGGRQDSYNSHDHYAWAKHHNAYNISMASNMTMECETGMVNPFLKRMQKVLGVFYTNADSSVDYWDTELSGFWLVNGMILYGSLDDVKQRLFLVRRGNDFDEAQPEINAFTTFYNG